uniref:TLDc domain-containing protein n=1 Tax=Entamoeba histolytica TaxID=5759 RepID=S0AW96_ENTHI|nr:hypothetical protein [Entamoeba histolytica]
MEELINKNNQLIKEVVETLPNIQQSIDDVNNNYQSYLESIKNEVFELKENETYSEAIKRGEGIFDRMDETERRRKLVIEKSQETINQIEIMKNKISKIIEECNNDEETFGKTRNELIDKIISIEEMIMKDKLFRRTEETDTITSEFNKKKEEWKKHYSDYLERKKRKEEEEEKERKKQEEERLQIMKGMNSMEEMRQIEEWTNKKVGNVLFESDVDDWNKNTSVFDQKIKNKEHIMIVIEDEEGNKFGGYVNSKIDEVESCITDQKSFLFSLESKGRMKRMMKFDIKEPRCAFYLNSQTDDCLFEFGFGHDICVFKENNKTQSYCYQRSFEYNGISNALCGKQLPERFTQKRIMVIEMK